MDDGGGMMDAGGERAALLWQKLEEFSGPALFSADLLDEETAGGVSLDGVVRMISHDPGLSDSVVAMCRCAHRSMHGAGVGFPRLAAMLGLRRIGRLVVVAQICGLLRDESAYAAEMGRGVEDSLFDERGLWIHGVAVATASEWIAHELLPLGGSVVPSDAFAAGLLSVAGRQALGLLAPRGYAWTVRLAAQSGFDALASERRTLGVDAGEAGLRLAERWGLPKDLSESMAAAGEPGEPGGPGSDLVSVVALAKWICRRYHLGWSGDWTDAGAGESMLSRLGLSRGVVESMVPGVMVDTGRCVELLGFGGPGFVPDRMPLVIADEANRTLDALIRRHSGRCASRSAGAARAKVA